MKPQTSNLCFRSLVFLSLIITAVSFSAIDRIDKSKSNIGQSIADQEDQQHKPSIPFWEKATDDPVAMFTLVLTAVTGILAVYTGVMGHATRRLVRGSEQTAERQLRAYIHIKRCDITNIEFAAFPTCAICIMNYGSTPAHSLNWTMRIRWVKTTEENELIPPNQTKQDVSLAPGGDMYRIRTWDDNIGNEIIDEMRSGKGALYVFGAIRYKDAFGNDRHTNFRLKYRGRKDGEGKPILEACEQGNDAT